MKFIATPIQGLWIIEPKIFEDERGFFMETYHREKFRDHGVTETFLQQNHSFSKRGVIRGIHFQTHPFAQGKLVTVTHGEVFDVAVDLRKDSPTFGKWYGINLTSANHRLLYIPPGFGHGFCALSDDVVFLYSCTNVYSPHHESGIVWNDATLNISWPIEVPVVSLKDQSLPTLRQAFPTNN